MKTIRRTYWSIILATLGIQFQLMDAQYAVDAIRPWQFNSAVGSRSQAMGNTGVGVADDYSALFSNPAGLSLQKSFEFSGGISRLGYGNDISFLGSTTNDNKSSINLDNLGIVYPIATTRGGLTFAFGYGRVTNFTGAGSFDGFNPSTSLIKSLTPNDNLASMLPSSQKKFLDNNIPFQLYLANIDTINNVLFPLVTDSVQQTGKRVETGGLNSWSFGGAIDIAKNISLGVTLNVVSGLYSREMQYSERDSKNVYHYLPPYDFELFTDETSVNCDISGFNALFGFLFRQPGKYRFGLTVRTPTQYDISETYDETAHSQFKPNAISGVIDKYDISLTQSTKYKITTPMVVSGGFSVQPNEWLLLAADAEYTDWTQMEIESDDFDVTQFNWQVKNSFQEAWNIRGGAEFTIINYGLKIRGGIEWKQTPYKNVPSSYNQLYYTCGIGIMLDQNVTINASVLLGNWNAHRYNYAIYDLPVLPTNESVNTQTLGASLSYRF